ncbi:4913_t:CDS:10 [Funneliformis caledonium]|uniref:4913_t:CDS:1 n=1 Tax=Funneliformis caledonium TaxID=1117310 RepID=A0A9N9GCS5_9GLOM|nr:4913_t:CDS:10 [Funneliformis caledonium]
MSQQRNALIKRASLYPLFFDDTIAQNNPIRGSRGQDSYEERVARLEKGMINIQEQVRIGFNHLSSEIRALSFSVEPRPQISNQKHKSIECNSQKSIKSDYLNDSLDEINDIRTDIEQDYFEDIIPICEKSFLEEEIKYKDSELQEETRKNLIKRKRKEIRVNSNKIKILLQSARFDKFLIDYTKKFSEIAPQLERELIPCIRIILEQCQFQKRERRLKGALSMTDDPKYKELIIEHGIEDVNEILGRNDYHSPEESDLENDPDSSIERKRLLLTTLLHTIDEYVEKHFPENKKKSTIPLFKSREPERDDFADDISDLDPMVSNKKSQRRNSTDQNSVDNDSSRSQRQTSTSQDIIPAGSQITVDSMNKSRSQQMVTSPRNPRENSNRDNRYLNSMHESLQLKQKKKSLSKSRENSPRNLNDGDDDESYIDDIFYDSKSYDNDDDYDLSNYDSGSLSKQTSSQDKIPISSSKSKSDNNYGHSEYES